MLISSLDMPTPPGLGVEEQAGGCRRQLPHIRLRVDGAVCQGGAKTGRKDDASASCIGAGGVVPWSQVKSGRPFSRKHHRPRPAVRLHLWTTGRGRGAYKGEGDVQLREQQWIPRAVRDVWTDGVRYPLHASRHGGMPYLLQGPVSQCQKRELQGQLAVPPSSPVVLPSPAGG